MRFRTRNFRSKGSAGDKSTPINIGVPIVSLNEFDPENYISTTNGEWIGLIEPFEYSYQWYDNISGLLLGEIFQDLQWIAYGLGEYYCIITVSGDNIFSVSVQSNIFSNLSYAPTATAATSVLPTSFTANWTAGRNNTGIYYVDLATDSVFSNYLVNDLNVGNMYSHTFSPLGGSHTYFVRVRGSLTVIVAPALRTSWQVTVNVVYVDGNSDEINVALATITDDSESNRYRLLIPNGSYISKTISLLGRYIDIIPQTRHGVDITYEAGIGVDLFEIGDFQGQIRGINMFNSINNYCVHSDNRPGHCLWMLYDCNFTTTNTALWAVAGGMYAGQNGYIVNCNISSQNSEGSYFHNRTLAESSGDTTPFSLRFINCNIVTLSPGTYKTFLFGNRNSGQTDSFIYFANTVVDTINFINEAAGIGETYCYIDPSCTNSSATFVDPAENLNLTDFTSLIVTNNLSISDNSNVIEVTTPSEGTSPLDNKKSNTIQFAWSVKDKLRTSYVGSFVSTTTPGAAVNTAYDQSLLGNNAVSSSQQPTYNVNGFGAGVPSITAVGGGTPSQIGMASSINIGTSYDLIATIVRSGLLQMFSTFNVPGIYITSNGATFFHFVSSGNSSITGQSIPDSAPIIVRIKRRGAITISFYLNETLLGTHDLNTSDVDFLVQYLVSTHDYAEAELGEMVILSGMPDSEVDSYIATIPARFGVTLP